MAVSKLWLFQSMLSELDIDAVFSWVWLLKTVKSRLSGTHGIRPSWNKPRIILGLGSANGRWCHIVTSSLIGWAHAQNDPCKHVFWSHSESILLLGSLELFPTLPFCQAPPITIEHVTLVKITGTTILVFYLGSQITATHLKMGHP